MNIGKMDGWDNIPFRDIFLSTGEKIGYIEDGITFIEEENEGV